MTRINPYGPVVQYESTYEYWFDGLVVTEGNRRYLAHTNCYEGDEKEPLIHTTRSTESINLPLCWICDDEIDLVLVLKKGDNRKQQVTYVNWELQ